MSGAMKRITVIGCGLIGGSFALGLKQKGFTGEIVGYDRSDVLEVAKRRGAIDRGTVDLGQAVAQANLVYLATPVGVIIDLLPRVAELAGKGCIVTDSGSTKEKICEVAAEVMPADAHCVFVGGHPMTGKEHGGIENASADLFSGAEYVVVADGRTFTTETPFDSAQGGEEEEVVGITEFLGWLRKLGAEPVWMTAAEHDRAVAWLSHLPQLLSTALAATAVDELGDAKHALSLAGPGFRDMVRLGGSPYDLWRDIFLTNKENIAQALNRLERELAHLREKLNETELGDEFQQAQAAVARLNAGRPEDG